MVRSTFYLLSLFTILAFFLRWYLMPSHLFFGPEQGRDFLAIRDIVYEKKFTLIGPKTDLSGVFHGPLYYYLAAIPFALSRGNPLTVSVTLTLVQAITVLLTYAVGKEISGKREVGILAAILFAVSYGAIVYSRWLTQVPLAMPFSFLFLWSLFRFLNGEKRALPWVAVSAALLGQVQFIYFLFVPIFLAYVIVRFRKHFSHTPRSIIYWSIASYFLVGGGTYLAFDLRHQFLITKSILSVFASGQHTSSTLLTAFREILNVFVRWVGDFMGLTTQLSATIFSVVLIIYLISQIRKKKWQAEILITWILVPALVLLVFRRGVLDQLFVGIVPGVIIATAMFMWGDKGDRGNEAPSTLRSGYLLPTLRRERNPSEAKTSSLSSPIKSGYFAKGDKGSIVIILSAIIVLNLWQVGRNFPKNQHIFFQAPQPDVRYSDQLQVIDEVYRRAGSNSFEIQAYTVPHAWQDGWQYLFWYRGTMRYGGILPVAHGGYRMFVIIQKDRANRTFQENWYRDIVTKLGSLTDKFTIGEYTVEERLMYE